MGDMLEELPILAQRIKEFVRGNPTEESAISDDQPSRLKGCAVLAARKLAEAAKASRWMTSFPVENDALSLAKVKSYENTINLLPIEYLPGFGTGLLRITGFTMRRPFSIRRDVSSLVMHADIEFSPLGWPELPDMVSTDFSTLFRESEPVAEPSARREFL